MPDLMDEVQERVQRENDALIARRATPAQAGTTACTTDGCDEPIAPQRTALGARLCLDCQRGEEARRAHFNRWSQR